MKPRKEKLLLVMHDEVEFSLWRLRLRVNGYHVLAVRSHHDAERVLKAHADCRLVLTDSDLRVIHRRSKNPVKVLLVGPAEARTPDMHADAFEIAGPVVTARVVNRLRSLLANQKNWTDVPPVSELEIAEPAAEKAATQPARDDEAFTKVDRMMQIVSHISRRAA